MNYEELSSSILDNPAESYLIPMNSHWWIHVPTVQVSGNQPFENYLPSFFDFNQMMAKGVKNYFTSLGYKVSRDLDEEAVSVDYLNVSLLNGFKQEYLIFGTSIVYFDGTNHWYIWRDLLND